MTIITNLTTWKSLISFGFLMHNLFVENLIESEAIDSEAI